MSTPLSGRWIGTRSVRLAGLLLTLASLLLLPACASLANRPPPVTVSEVVDMSHHGVPPQQIIDRMQESGTVYRLSATQLAQLKDKGVPDSVLNYMQETYLTSVRRRQELADERFWTFGPDGYWYGGYALGWP
jgi:hypothetical protein